MTHDEMAGIFEKVKVLPLRSTDILVFRAARLVSSAQEQRLVEALRERTGHCNILVVDKAGDLDIIRPEVPGLVRRMKEALLG